MTSIQRSNFVLAKILNLALENGLSHWNLEFRSLKLESEYETFFYPCIEWLEAEGLIRVGTYSRTIGGLADGWVKNIALTSLGMEVLGRKVEVLGNQESLADAVQKASEGNVDYHKITDALGGLIGGFLKSLAG